VSRGPDGEAPAGRWGGAAPAVVRAGPVSGRGRSPGRESLRARRRSRAGACGRGAPGWEGRPPVLPAGPTFRARGRAGYRRHHVSVPLRPGLGRVPGL